MKIRHFISKKGWPCVMVSLEVGDELENSKIIARNGSSVRVRYGDGYEESLLINQSKFFDNLSSEPDSCGRMRSPLVIQESVAERYDMVESLARRLNEQYNNHVPYDPIGDLLERGVINEAQHMALMYKVNQ